jgi:cytochrome d ubiquinol oxidase subunit I
MPGIVYSFYLFTAVYFSLAIVVAFMLYRQIKMVGKLYNSAGE